MTSMRVPASCLLVGPNFLFLFFLFFSFFFPTLI